MKNILLLGFVLVTLFIEKAYGWKEAATRTGEQCDQCDHRKKYAPLAPTACQMIDTSANAVVYQFSETSIDVISPELCYAACFADTALPPPTPPTTRLTSPFCFSLIYGIVGNEPTYYCSCYNKAYIPHPAAKGACASIGPHCYDYGVLITGGSGTEYVYCEPM